MSAADPFALFRQVLAEAEATGMTDPNAMCLTTVAPDGQPSSRMVLLKAFDELGFVFYTNTLSRKGRELTANPRVSLTFYWRELGRQVHVHGRSAAVTAEEADAYFATRPRGSQIGAWASRQSEPLRGGRAELLLEAGKVEARHFGRAIPRPPHWSGYRVTPHAIEFWVAGPFRMHDRTLYERGEHGWQITRLFP